MVRENDEAEARSCRVRWHWGRLRYLLLEAVVPWGSRNCLTHPTILHLQIEVSFFHRTILLFWDSKIVT